MRRAMAEAEVGDDVFGEDPTVAVLEEEAAAAVGTEAALFVPSGTMANQLAIRVHTRPGDVVLAGEGAHVLLYESGAASALAGVQIQTVGRGGLFDGADVRAAIHPPDHHYAPTRLVAVENTHNQAGGVVFPLARVRDVSAAARERGLALHLDGARLWNAVAATGVPAREWAACFDTVACCLSKGLGAPVGSLLAGDAPTIERAHRYRKMLGGGMRQAGILAAAGLHALDHHVDRLKEDHANARRLADGLARLGLRVDPAPETNMVFFAVPDELGFLRATRARDLLVNPVKPGFFRAVTHLDVDAKDVDEALARVGEALAELRA
jgi:threonine aldolase